MTRSAIKESIKIRLITTDSETGEEWSFDTELSELTGEAIGQAYTDSIKEASSEWMPVECNHFKILGREVSFIMTDLDTEEIMIVGIGYLDFI